MSVILFFAILLLLVLVHEFGHFFVAKRSGIRVDEFAFGFPPRLFGVTKGETTYSFNALPLGGYVKIFGEDASEVTSQDRARSFSAQHRVIQGAVVIAGIVSNLLLAWILIAATFMVGIPASSDAALPYKVTGEKLMITELSPASPALIADLRPGDTLIALSDDSERIDATSPEVVSRFVATRAGHPIVVSFLRDKVEQQLTITPVSGIVPDRAAIGIAMDMVGTLKLSVFESLRYGAIKTYEYTYMTATGIFDFFKTIVVGHADFTQVTGPVGIVQAVGSAAGLGIANLLLFTALISINLAVINILPFPALDGGRLLFIVIEGVMRKPIKPAFANTMNLIGFGLLMLLMILVTYHDVIKLF